MSDFAVIELSWEHEDPPMQDRILGYRVEQSREGFFFKLYDNLPATSKSVHIKAPPGPLVECKLTAMGVNGQASDPGSVGFRLTQAMLDDAIKPPTPKGFTWRIIGLSDTDDESTPQAPPPPIESKGKKAPPAKKKRSQKK
jgi:hypothetical protein